MNHTNCSCPMCVPEKQFMQYGPPPSDPFILYPWEHFRTLQEYSYKMMAGIGLSEFEYQNLQSIKTILEVNVGEQQQALAVIDNIETFHNGGK